MSDASEVHRTRTTDYDAVIVGASLAGCTTAIMLGRAGARVALVEKQPDPHAFKRVCGHFIQASAIPTLERLGLLDPIVAAGGVRSRMRIWTRWGWIEPPEQAGYAINLRRELLDPLIKEVAAKTPRVELLLRLISTGVTVRNAGGDETELSSRFVVGADGRDSRIARLAGVGERVFPHGRFSYGAYFEGAEPEGSPDGSLWFMDPQWGAAFPTDGGLTLFGAMPTKDRLPEFKRDPEAALVSFFADMPDAPPIRAGRQVGPIIGRLDLPNRVRYPTAAGLALVGDAALATDPLYGVGCGWAFQSAEWLTESISPALHGEEALERGLRRYRRRHAGELRGHAYLIHDYATGRRFKAGERMIFAAAARDPKIAAAVERMATRRAKPLNTISRVMPRAMAVNSREAVLRQFERLAMGTKREPGAVGG